MNLESGTRLGPYRIESVLGAGGMGVVYRAQDTRLGRSVAIKVLPATLTANADARARLENEARAVAALSHPHICAIHDIGRESDGTEYLVMELLEGKTLAECIARGPLPLKDVLRYGEEIAEALHCAHRAGITHRDLKPGNIMITPGGAKLLDFGLAKTLSRGVGSSEDSATLVQSPPLTEEGTILGTVQYMSPEQIENRNVDHRSDIFALGVVLYEMATGRRPFGGSSPMSIVSSILSEEPAPVHSLQPSVPVELERIITTALEKNPDDRWQTAHDVALQLKWLREGGSNAGSVAAKPPRGWFRSVAPYLGVAVAAIALSVLAMKFTRAAPSAQHVIRLHLAPPPQAGTIVAGEVPGYAISPDGNSICFSAVGKDGTSLYVRALDSFDARRIDGTDGATGPFWSDDGKSIGFSARTKLWRVSAAGDTPPTALCDVASAGAGGTWHGNTILFGDAADGRRGIFRLDASGGDPVAVVTPAGSEWREALPYFLPDGKHFLYIALSDQSITRSLVFASVDGKSRRELLHNVSQGRIGGDGRLMYVQDGKLLAQQFNQETGELSGQPVILVDGVRYFLATATASFDATPSGVLAYRTNSRVDRLSLIDRSGSEKKLLDDDDQFFDVAVSPDGRTAAVTVLAKGNGMGDIWLYELERGTREPFTSEIAMEFSPVFSSDGKSIYYGAAEGRMPHVVQRAIGSPTVESITAEGRFRYPRSITRDGSTLFFTDRNPQNSTDILELSTASHQVQPIHATAAVERDPAVSSDGRYLAYAANTSGRMEVYLQDLTASGARPARLSGKGGWLPRWRRDGRELYFLSLDMKTISVVKSEGGSWQDATSVPLFNTTNPVIDYDVLPEGQTFVVAQAGSEEDDDVLHVVVTR